MTDPLFRRSMTPLSASTIAYLRTWVGSALRVPAPPYVGASPLTPEHTRLLLSSTYGAGLRVCELARTRIDAFLDGEGRPRGHVRIQPGTTRMRRSRRAPMHPDVRRDALAFQERHPDQQFLAFVPFEDGSCRAEPMHAHGLGVWFSQLYRQAGLAGLSGDSGRLFFSASARRAEHA